MKTKIDHEMEPKNRSKRKAEDLEVQNQKKLRFDLKTQEKERLPMMAKIHHQRSINFTRPKTSNKRLRPLRPMIHYKNI